MTSTDVPRGSQGRQELEVNLGRIHVDRVLDVATGEGSFACFLAERLGSYGEIVGIDVLRPSDDSERVFCQERIRFLRMDAENLAFEAESFDVVAMSSSLHHFAEPSKVLEGMWCALAPGGYFIVRETSRDVGSEAERTDMELHHWVARIDRLLGTCHAVTYTRTEILALVDRLRLSDMRIYDLRNTDSDPFDPEAIRSTEETIDEYLRAAAGLPEYPALREEAEDLRTRLRAVGIQWEPEVFVVGRKT